MMHEEHHKPGPQTLKAVRGALVVRGSSLARWADEKGVKRQNLTKAILGKWNGPKGQAWFRAVVEDVLGSDTGEAAGASGIKKKP
ncbi:hypothetical protein ACVDG3_15925 [Meridianimarinicoccus sp. RP-17]|uniref:hypothetical protein n=1 Tax=Meridianimarinicoccus zhengii TaxID=2056810 RepID=UPI0013A6EE1B|nr:hypothetical protein [Phycocomes zhengii]